MKMKLFYSCIVACVLSLTMSCNDEKETLPPTVEDIVAEYSGSNLKTIVNGVETTVTNSRIELVKADQEGKVNIVLHNIVPRSKKVIIPNVDFSTKTKTAYVSRLVGEVDDYECGYNVRIIGTVDEKTMIAEFMFVELHATDVNTLPLHGLVYKGDMEITVNATPTTLLQRVYLSKATPTNDGSERDTSMVKFSIENFNFNGTNIPKIDIDTVKIDKRGEFYGFEVTDRVLFLKIGSETVEVPVKLYGFIVEEKITMNMELNLNPMTVTVDFTGESVVENNEAKMISMEITADMILKSVYEDSKATLTTWENTPYEKLLITPIYEISENATIDSITVTVFNGDVATETRLSNDVITGKQPIDFSPLKLNTKNFIKYYIAGEDPNKKGSYSIYMELMAVTKTKFVFDETAEWTLVQAGKYTYYDPKGWATSNSAATTLMTLNYYPKNTPYPVSQNETKEAKIITVNTRGFALLGIPATTAGTLFLGKFDIVMADQLKSTQFGVPYHAEPISIKGSYKYTAGPVFHKGNPAKPVPDRTDFCSISAILYEVDDFTETLDGKNFSNSPKIVATATITNGTTDGFVDFDVPMGYLSGKTYDPKKKYKFTFICSSSKDGAIFEGAPGSELLIRSIEVVNK